MRIAAASDDRWAAMFREFDPSGAKIEPHGTLGYRPRPGTVFAYPNGTAAHINAAGYRGPLVTRDKPAGALRVVLLGGSTTHGWGVDDDETIDHYLRAELRRRFEGRQVDVINLGFDGYDAYQDFERLRTDGLALAPDLVIMNSGINDVRNARFAALRDRDPRSQLWGGVLDRLRREQREGPGLWSRVKRASYLARVPGMLRSRMQQREASTGARTATAPNVTGAADNFGVNVRRVIALASQHGAAVLVSTPPSSLRSRYSPGATSRQTYWIVDARTTQEIRDSLDARLRAIATGIPAGAGGYVPHALADSLFLDDCHLTPAGNAAMAASFAAAAEGLLRARPVSNAPTAAAASGGAP